MLTSQTAKTAAEIRIYTTSLYKYYATHTQLCGMY